MKPGVSTFEDPNKQRVAYRGYVIQYSGNTRTKVHCTQVRVNRLKALDDGKRLLAKIRKDAHISQVE